MKSVLIVGKGSYIGESLCKWLEGFQDCYRVRIVSSRQEEWKEVDWKDFDVAVNCAGIAHVRHITNDMNELFYSINRDLSVEIATWAKRSGIKHYIHFSSMNVYGDFVNNLRDRSQENPTSFYGDSKLQGDMGIRALEDVDFLVSYMRPPFVYGKGCKGNYNTISRIAQLTPVFPTYNNKKSMIYIDNLCEFVRMCIEEKLGGILTPQNKELKSTADLVCEIAKNHNKQILSVSMFNWMIKLLCKATRLFRRAFANDCYSPVLSDYWEYEYCVVSFVESIRRTETNI